MSGQTVATELLGRRVLRISGLVLMLAPLLEIVGMAHHPSVHGHDAAQLVQELRAAAGSAAIVHGVLIALMFATLLALTEYSLARGLARAAVRVGLIAYAAGVLALTAAALVSGFVTPRLAFVNPALAPPDPALTVQLTALAMLFNQAFAKYGAVLVFAGMAAWSFDLLRDGRGTRVLGVFGLVAGIGGSLALCSGALRLDVHGMTVVAVLEALWTVGAGWLLWQAAGRTGTPALAQHT
jgi:hypothetical protein